MVEIVQKIKQNPLQTITVGIAVIGVVFSILNFYLLANISPIERRVAALESVQEKNLPYVQEFVTFKQIVVGMSNDVSEMKADIKTIVQLHIK